MVVVNCVRWCEKWRRRTNANLWPDAKSNFTHTYIKMAQPTQTFLFKVASSDWKPAYYFDQNLILYVPHLWFTLSVLCALLVSHNKTEHAHCKPLGGGERDWEIKFILNSFSLMCQLPPPFPLLHLFSPPQAAQHRVCAQSTSRLCFVHRKHFFHPQLHLKLHSCNGMLFAEKKRAH